MNQFLKEKGRFLNDLLFISILLLTVFSRSGFAVSANDGFDPNANFTVRSLALQADGKILIGGWLGVYTNTVGGVERNGIARLNIDGSLDPFFNPNANDCVTSIAVQTDGRILVGGYFTAIGGVGKNHIARLNADGSIDTSFGANVSSDVESILIQDDGKILVGGWFSTVNGLTRKFVARLNSDGSLDSSFNAGDVYSDVRSMGIQSDGKVVIAGDFTRIKGVIRNHVARLDSNGNLDMTFNPNVNNTPVSLAIQPDGKILIGGGFTAVNDITRNHMARLNSDGSLDASFDPNTNNSLVRSLAIQPDGKILTGGDFTTIGGITKNHLARLNSDGTVDSSLDPNVNDMVVPIMIQPDGKIVIGGAFTTIGGVTRNHLARITANGSLDATLNPGADNAVLVQAVQADGKIVVGGMFATLGGQPRSRIGRLNADGTLDTTFNPGATSTVSSLVVQADGKILVAGGFTTLGGQARNYLGRLNADGTLDMTFNPGANYIVYSLAVQPDGKILVGGGFTMLAGQARWCIGRLNADGTLDTTFNPGASGTVYTLVVQADGKIIAGGEFTSLGGQTRRQIGRLNPDGTLDTTFNPGTDNFVNTLSVQADGKILVGGYFSTLGGQAHSRIGRLNADGSTDMTFNPGADNTVFGLALQSNGKVLVGGAFTMLGGQARNYIGRFNADGTLDTTFNPGADNTVYSLVGQLDGKILVGGRFTTLGGQARNYIGRLTNTDAALQDLNASADGTSVTWKRSGAGPEVWRTTFEESSDGTAWTMLGYGTRTSAANGWVITGLSQPIGPGHAIRARGYATSGSGNGSSSVLEAVRLTAPQSFIVSVSTGTNGTISPNTAQNITAGGTASFLITPDTGYSIGTLTGCNGTLVGSRYTTGPIAAACTVSATFVPITWTLSIAVTGSGMVHTSPGTDLACTSGCGTSYNEGTVVTLSATPGPGYSFAGWSGACSGTSSCQVTMNAANSVTATFVPQPSFIVSVSTGTNGAISPNTAQNITLGGTASFSITPDPGFRIRIVTGCNGSIAGNTYTTGPINADCAVTATFVPSAWTFSVAVIGNGTVHNQPGVDLACTSNCGTSYNDGDQVMLMVMPNQDSTFVGWGGACSGTDPVCTVTMSGTTDVTAIFAIVDTDGDGVADIYDNCPTVANPDQTSTNGFGFGDACTAVHCVSTSAGLQAALNDAMFNQKNDVIRLVQGTYAVSGNNNMLFYYASLEHFGVAIEGGYIAGCQSQTLDPANTVLDGENHNMSAGGAGVLNLYATDYAPVSFSVRGLTIRNGRGNAAGGLYLGLHSGTITVENNVVRNNFSNIRGGGMYLVSDSNASIIIRNNIVQNNTSQDAYAGIYAKSDVGYVALINNVITDNVTNSYALGGAGVLTDYGSIDVINNTIANNRAAGPNSYGAGLYVEMSYAQSRGNIYNNIFWGNTANSHPDLDVNNWNSTANIFSNDVDPAKMQTSGSVSMGNNLNIDPLFANPATGDYHLAAGSPLINAGSNNAPNLPASDIAGNTRINGGTVDMGAYETMGQTLTISRSGTGSGTVTSIPTGIDCGSNCIATFNNDTIIFLTPTPGTGYTFTGWSGDCSGTGICQVTMSAARNVTATFAPSTWTLNVAVTGSGTVHTSPGVDLACTSNCGTSFNEGTVVTLFATPSTGYHIASVTGCGGTLNGSTYTTGPVTADCTVSATFAINTYAVTPIAGLNGSMSPATLQTIDYLQSAVFSVATGTGYHIASVTGCGGVLAGNVYTTGPITGDCTVSATFAINTYTVTPIAGLNGSMSPATPQTIDYLQSAVFTITPNTGYHIGLVTGCSGTLNGSTYTTGPVTADCSVSATFAVNTYTVTPSAGANGSISPSTPQAVNYNLTPSFTVTPDIGYHIALVTGCSGTLNGSTYTTGSVTADCTVSATFAINTYTVTPSVGSNGSISPSTLQTVNYIQTVPFTITPDPGYHIALVTGCSGTLIGNTYTTGPVTADCTVSATFAINTYTVTPSAGANGSINPSTPQTINYNQTAVFTITPNTGYHIALVTGCSGTLNGSTYTTGPVTAACTVTATFAINTYTVTPSAGANGSISPSAPQTINYNQTAVFTITPNTGYHIALVTGCSGMLNGSIYTTGPVTANCAVSATFAINTYNLTVIKTGTGSGTVTSSPAGISCGSTCSATYNNGTVVTLTAAPSADSLFTGWSGGVCSGTGTCVTTMNAAKTVTATFTQYLTVTVPNGSETWSRGSTYTIRWNYAGNPGSNVKIELLKGGALNRTISSSTSIGSSGSGSYSWKVPSNQTVGSDYTIRVTSTSNSNYKDTSNANFTIQ